MTEHERVWGILTPDGLWYETFRTRDEAARRLTGWPGWATERRRSLRMWRASGVRIVRVLISTEDR